MRKATKPLNNADPPAKSSGTFGCQEKKYGRVPKTNGEKPTAGGFEPPPPKRIDF